MPRLAISGKSYRSPRSSLYRVAIVGSVFVARHIRSSAWFRDLSPALHHGCVKPSLVRCRSFALKLANACLDHARDQWVRLGPVLIAN